MEYTEQTTLSKYVKAMRKQYNLTQVELSEKSGVGLRFVRELEQGKKNITDPPYDSVPLAPYVSVMWRMSSGDPDEFINRSMARYLGIESIRVAVPEP